MGENKKEVEVENLEIEALSDADLESNGGGGPYNVDSTAMNACCGSTASDQ